MKIRTSITCDGVTETHIHFSALGYATLCGLDGEDGKIGQTLESVGGPGPVTCVHCIAIAEEGRKWTGRDFLRKIYNEESS